MEEGEYCTLKRFLVAMVGTGIARVSHGIIELVRSQERTTINL